MVRAPNQQGFLATFLEEERRGVTVVVFTRNFIIPWLLPTQFATQFIEPRDPRLSSVQTGHDDMIVGHDWGTAFVPEKLFSAELLDQVGLPPNRAVQSERGEVAALEVNVNLLTISYRR